MTQKLGYVYILQLSAPIGKPRTVDYETGLPKERIAPEQRCKAQYYVGYADDLEKRIHQHRKGCGAKFTRAAIERGVGFQVVALWTGDRTLERKLKNLKDTPSLMRRLRSGYTPKNIPSPFYVEHKDVLQ